MEPIGVVGSNDAASTAHTTTTIGSSGSSKEMNSLRTPLSGASGLSIGGNNNNNTNIAVSATSSSHINGNIGSAKSIPLPSLQRASTPVNNNNLNRPPYRASADMSVLSQNFSTTSLSHREGLAESTARPVSDIYPSAVGTGHSSSANAAAAAAAEAAAFAAATSTNTAAAVSSSSVSGHNNPESEVLDQWMKELQQYEATLEEMTTASMDPNFKEEIHAIEQWFKVLSEAERTTALYSMLQQSTPLQMRFFMTVLGQMIRRDPVGSMLSPTTNVDRGILQQQSKGLSSTSTAETRNNASLHLNAQRSSRVFSGGQPTSTVSSGSSSTTTAMFPDAVAAVAHQRALLVASRQTGLRSGDGWGDAPIRPRSADVSALNWQAQRLSLGPHTGSSNLASIKSPRHSTPAIFDPLSPFVGGNWSSMANTPISSNFSGSLVGQQQQQGGGGVGVGNSNRDAFGDIASRKLMNWSSERNSMSGTGQYDSNNGNRILLDSDVRKFRRSQIDHSLQTDRPTSIVMYDEHGQVQAVASQQTQSRAFTGNTINTSTTSNNNNNNNNNNSNSNSSNNMGNSSGASQVPMTHADSVTSFAGTSGTVNTPINSKFQRPASPFASGSRINNTDSSLLHGGGGGNGIVRNDTSALYTASPYLSADYDGLSSHCNTLIDESGYFESDPRDVASPSIRRASANYAAMSTPLQQSHVFRNSPQQIQAPLFTLTPNGPQSQSRRPTTMAVGHIEDPTDPALLNDVPAWLRSLRLHKYTDNLKSIPWQELIEMTDSELEQMGVGALGARRKLLKTFDMVKERLCETSESTRF